MLSPGQPTPHIRTPRPDGVTLRQFLAQHFLELSGAARWAWIDAAASFCRDCHNAGARVGGAFRTSPQSPWRFSLAGDPANQQRPSLDPSSRWEDLAILLSESMTRTRRGDRFRFLRAYDLTRRRFRSMRSSLRRLEESAFEIAAREWRGADVACLRSGPGFVFVKVGAFRIVHRRDDEAAEALTVLLRDPDRWLSSGESRSDRGSSCESAKVILAGRPYLLKRYDCRGILYRFKNAFRRSRALRSWIGAWGLLARGIAVAKPLVVMEERHGPLLGRSYILSEYLEEGQRMMDAWPHMAAPEKRRLLAQCAILLGRMNAMNMVHGDTNWNNILLFGPRSALQTALVDLDGCRPLRRLTHARALRDVDHFVRDMIRERNRADEFVECFLASWVRWLRPRQQKRRVPAHPFRQRYRGLR